MAKIFDVDPSKLIKELAKELKNVEQVNAPEWAAFAKTGSGKERPPAEKDWWHMRSASVLRKVYISGPIGVSKLRKKYSSKKNRGHKPERVYPAGGNILRKILQQLEKAELLKFSEKGVHKGRIITSKGAKLLNQIAKNLSGPSLKKNVHEEKKVEPVKVEEKVVEVKEPLLKKEVHEKKENGSGSDKGGEDKGAAK